MRVLLTNHFPLEGSGSGIYTSNVARELVAAGHEAMTITPEHESPGEHPFLARSIPFPIEGPDGFDFPCFTTHPRSSATFYDLTEDQIGIYTEAWTSAIAAAIDDFDPDLIHGQHLWIATAIAVESGRPVVATCHGTDLMGWRQDARYRAAAEAAAHGARRIIAVSRAMAADVESTFGIGSDVAQVVGNGFDTAIFHPPTSVEALRAEMGIDIGDGRLVVFAGKLADFKGVDVLLDAAAIYETRSPSLYTYLVGDGDLRGDLERQVDDLGLQRIHFLGHQPQGELARWFAAADVCVFPSRREPFGLVAIEAMACGSPVVATDEGGLPDFVTPDVGVLVPVDDARALAAAIVDQGDQKATKGPIAARVAAASHSWNGRVAETIDVYQTALGQGTPDG